MNSYAGVVLGHLDRLFHRGTVAGLNEGALLERYVADGDEAAFAALVALHGPMVLGVCRRVLRDERDVEDAFQATFLVLVRRAGAIRDGDLVGRWLHGVAHRVAVRARAHAASRFVHEQSVSEPIEAGAAGPASCEAERRELAAIVDEEVTRLPSTLRAPVVLCYLEGMTHDEAARRLRWPVGTVRSRMARARDVLRHRLARRGVTADGAALATAFARPAVPPEWLDATVRGSLNFATRPATAAATIASARSVALARRILQTMVIAKLSFVGAAGLGLVLALGGVRTLAFQSPGEEKPIGLASGPPRKAADPATAHISETPVHQSLHDPNRKPSSLPIEFGDDLDRAMHQLAVLQARLRKTSPPFVELGDDLDRAMRQLADLQARLRKMEGDRGPSRREEGRPTATRAFVPPTPAIAAGKDEKPGDPDRPRYIELGDENRIVFMVVSPDGSRVGTYDPANGKTRSFKLPAIRGVRREFQHLGLQGSLFNLTGTQRSASPPGGTALTQTRNSWFLAMDVDRTGKITRIAAFNALDQSWAGEDLPEPVERSSARPVAGAAFMHTIGHRIYGFSSAARRWGVLEFPPGVIPTATMRNGRALADRDGRLFVFNVATGLWDDIYARAIEAEPAANGSQTRDVPAQ